MYDNPFEPVKRKTLSNALVIIAFLFIVAAIFFVVVFRVRPYKIYGHSMNPTLYEGELVFSRSVKKYNRGDVIVFELDNAPTIKRIIGVPGDKVYIDDSGIVKVNDQTISEPYVSSFAKGQIETQNPCIVSNGYYYVLGDNRGDSKDSRLYKVGQIREDLIMGKVFFSLSKFKKIS